MPHEVSDPKYWSGLYQSGDAGWDKGCCAPPIARLLRETFLPPGAKLAVIGCGRGHEAFEAARLGFEVVAIDFAPEAVQAVRERAASMRIALSAEQVDLFDLAHRWPSGFDAIIEHTCFCAIDPHRRDEYVDVTAAALKPGGHLCGLFYAHNRPDGPPFTTDVQEVQLRLARRFRIERLMVAPDSFPHRAGCELEFVAVR